MQSHLVYLFKEGLIEVREIEKGVDAVITMNLLHPAVRAHRVPGALREVLRAPPVPQSDTDYVPPVVREMYCITANVAEVFAPLK